ncbi:MAG: hypothetical protein Q4F65_09010 [Propionibacteriaceae bacterium]|nr:hypothetical protein [Propionibacteriaceae bacterium]
MSWPAVALDTPLRDLIGTSVVAEVADEAGTPHVLVARFAAGAKGVRVDHTMRIVETTDRLARRWGGALGSTLPQDTPLDAAFLALRHVRMSRAARPDVRWPALGGRTLAVTIALSVVAIGLLLSVLVDSADPALMAMVYGPLATAVFWPRRDGTASMAPGPRVLDDERELTPEAILELMPPATALSAQGPTPVDRADVVRAAYGELLGDVVYRIENSALFDASVPATQRFQLALLSWEPDADDADALATELEESFAAARSNAERLGLDHLPLTAREPAQRASRAAALALGTEQPAEREAAAGRAAELLSNLALYYLPTIDPGVASLVGERRAISS